MFSSFKFVKLVGIFLLVEVLQLKNVNAAEIKPATVDFFHLTNYEGFSYSDNYTPGCHEMPPYFRKNVQSINVNGKRVRLFEGSGCTGVSFWLHTSENDLLFGSILIDSGIDDGNWRNKAVSWEPYTIALWEATFNRTYS